VWLADPRVELGALTLTAPHLLDECDLDEDLLALVFDVIDAAAAPDDLRTRLDALRAQGKAPGDATPQIHLLKADRAAAAAKYDPFELEAWTALAKALPGVLM
jgi:hypothetical protein